MIDGTVPAQLPLGLKITCKHSEIRSDANQPANQQARGRKSAIHLLITALFVVGSILWQSHRTMSRVKSVSSPQLVVVFLVIAVGAAAAAVPFWKNIAVSGTLFWMFDPGQGVCMRSACLQ